MPELNVICSGRPHRHDAGLSQGELAEQVGVSRQAIIAIEAGKQVPSTAIALRLAMALRCDVEDLFRVSAPARLSASLAALPKEPSTARFALGQVDGVWAAHPLFEGNQPADALLVGDASLAESVAVEPLCDVAELQRNVLVAGCAPLLGVLTGCLAKRFEDARATWLSTNSTQALKLLARGLVHVAGLHLVDSEAPGGHADMVRQRFGTRAMTIVNLTRWRQGLVVQKSNPLGIHDVTDLLRPDVCFAGRDAGAGAQQLLERLLAAKGVEKGAILAGPLASGHGEVARWVRLGLADVGIAIEAAALSEGLDFIALAEERFDLIVPEARLAVRPVARLLELIERPEFQADAAHLAGYDLSSAGQAITVAAA